LIPLTNEDVKKGRCSECHPPKLELVAKAEFMNEEGAVGSLVLKSYVGLDLAPALGFISLAFLLKDDFIPFISEEYVV
jgi:hypothetical protein